MASKQSSQKPKSAFSKAVTADGKTLAKKLPMKWIVRGGIAAVPLLLVLGYFWVTSMTVPPKGNNLYGLCRAYIELHLRFPQTLRIIQMEQKVPDGEDPNNPQRVNYDITFSSIDGFGQNLLNTLTCEFKFDEKLLNTPWQGIFLERVLFDKRSTHGWADVYYPPDKKNPRAADDRSEELERFFNSIPSLLINPPDLTLPWNNINKMSIGQLQDL